MTDRSRSPIWSRALLVVLVVASVCASPLGSTSATPLGSEPGPRPAAQHRTRFVTSSAAALPASSQRATKQTFTHRFKVAVGVLRSALDRRRSIRGRRIAGRLPARVSLRVRERRPPDLQIVG